jgi:hypothetical protein
MSLQSDLFRDDGRLQACLTNNASHLVEGTIGSHVAKVQVALFIVDGLGIQYDEVKSQRYGPSTAKAVLAFKTKRRIINYSYQTTPDNIVGKMTIAALDRELLTKQAPFGRYSQTYCGNDPMARGPATWKPATGSPFAPVMLTSAAGSAGLTAAPSGGGLSPAAVAKTRAPAGIDAVRKARLVVARLLSFHRHPTVPAPQGILLEFDAVWRYFGMPKFPLNDPTLSSQTNGAVNTLEDYLQVLEKVLTGTEKNLGQASTLFRDVPEPWFVTAHAFTLALTRDPADPPQSAKWPDGMYFNPRYLSDGSKQVGPLKQTEVAVHECGHFVQNDNIADIATQSLSSAYGYSGYVLHCAFNRDTAFADTE